MATLSIPITKAKGKTFDIDEADINTMMDENPSLIKEAFKVYFSVMLNLGMSKLPATKELKGEELEQAQEVALAKAKENFEAIKDGSKIAKRGASGASKSSKAPKEILTEALRQCKEIIRDRLKAKKVRISTVAAKDITAAAKKLLAEREEFYLAKAKATLDERAAEANGEADTVDADLPKPDAKLVAKAEKEKAERKAATSAKQAGMTEKRAGKGKKGPIPPRRGDTPQHVSH